MNAKHFGKVNEAGKLFLANGTAFKQEIASLRNKRVYLTISENKPPRSNQENRYYWGVVLKLVSQTTGYTPEEIHELMRYMFLPKKEVMGQEIIGSTTELKTNEFEDYLTRIRGWAQEKLNIRIPLPNEVEY
jgi:hypothetical protein